MPQQQPPPPPLEYPTLYTFRAIGKQVPHLREHVRLLVQSVVGPLPDEALTERPSSGGAYKAIHVSCLLTSEEQRRAVYTKFYEDALVVFSL